mmetsp:Transcript_54285/g.140142  ORF Transcript_54285/g.140142 Transcript_54285/m.140142 type:complete len:213 (+) Transcript_54285:962-1600(+)
MGLLKCMKGVISPPIMDMVAAWKAVIPIGDCIHTDSDWLMRSVWMIMTHNVRGNNMPRCLATVPDWNAPSQATQSGTMDAMQTQASSPREADRVSPSPCIEATTTPCCSVAGLCTTSKASAANAPSPHCGPARPAAAAARAAPRCSAAKPSLWEAPSNGTRRWRWPSRGMPWVDSVITTALSAISEANIFDDTRAGTCTLGTQALRRNTCEV